MNVKGSYLVQYAIRIVQYATRIVQRGNLAEKEYSYMYDCSVTESNLSLNIRYLVI